MLPPTGDGYVGVAIGAQVLRARHRGGASSRVTGALASQFISSHLIAPPASHSPCLLEKAQEGSPLSQRRRVHLVIDLSVQPAQKVHIGGTQ